MSSKLAISVQNLSKCYHIYDRPSGRLLQMLHRGRKRYFKEFWALRNVSFDVRAGETVGVVGRNGSGKSTLLQLICGTLNASQGEVTANGRVAALLELGSGFNQEFTGRENVYLYASVLGLSKQETDRKFDEIAAFADIGEFIEQPIKSYSSGMVVRLAFAVAISVEPQILIVDEALSVGDELFQRKCFSKIEQIKERGATILFVSHSGAAVIELCDRAVLLDAGEMIQLGTPKEIVGLYQRLLYATDEQRQEIRKRAKVSVCSVEAPEESTVLKSKESDAGSPASVAMEGQTAFFDPHLKPQSSVMYEPHGAVISNPMVYTSQGERANCLVRGDVYTYTYQVQFSHAASGVYCGMLIKTTSGVELGGCSSGPRPEDRISFVPAEGTLRVSFQFTCNLNPGIYYLNAGVLGEVDGESRFLHRILDAMVIRVLPTDTFTATGFVDFGISPQIQLDSGSDSVANL